MFPGEFLASFVSDTSQNLAHLIGQGDGQTTDVDALTSSLPYNRAKLTFWLSRELSTMNGIEGEDVSR